MTPDQQAAKAERDKVMIRDINENPELLSLLYDVDLLPEQLNRESKEWAYMCLLVCAFKLGQKSILKS